ncbi:MAG TPA: hypothetical protein VJ765_15775 [Chitinophagaceae bacterium]|nr:hypothetical protein [Chitinophagaceae bacterium]
MARIFITGSADGLGLLAAKQLQDKGDKRTRVFSHHQDRSKVPSMKPGIVLILLFCLCTSIVVAQKNDSTFLFKTDLSVTNNGFSIIPAFTLGKPAALLDMKMGNKRLSFEPQFRFALEGRPWSFVFIYRYKAITRSKFQLTFGGHIPGLNFVTRRIAVSGVDEDMSVVRRFLAGEIIPKYIISKNVSISIYYLRGHGFQKDGPQTSNFLSLQGSFTRIKVAGKVYVDFKPQLFYLTVDADDGFYANATTTIGIMNFPITISNIVNKAIKSDIAAKDFDWNLSLVYTIDKNFVVKSK